MPPLNGGVIELCKKCGDLYCPNFAGENGRFPAVISGFRIPLDGWVGTMIGISVQIGDYPMERLAGRAMAALAGVGSYGIVFHTKIARSSRRACNFMIPKGECAPAVFSIPIARSTLQPMLASASQWRAPLSDTKCLACAR
jgi:hypothetical protein